MEAIIAVAGGHTTYMSNGSAKKGDWFLWDFQLKFDMKITYTMEKPIILFVLVNCPRVKNQASRFTIDNNFFYSTYRAPRYFKNMMKLLKKCQMS